MNEDKYKGTAPFNGKYGVSDTELRQVARFDESEAAYLFSLRVQRSAGHEADLRGE